MTDRAAEVDLLHDGDHAHAVIAPVGQNIG
jgi:hypothetical protein